MASWHPDNGRLGFRNEVAQGGRSAMPEDAHVLRVYAFDDRAGAQQAFTDARSAAEAAGWALGETSAVTDARIVSGTKQLRTGSAEFSATLIEARELLPDGVEPPALALRLTHDYAPD